MNGVSEAQEGPPEGSNSHQQQPPAYPLPQLKQMLSQQLEYYFSR